MKNQQNLFFFFFEIKQSIIRFENLENPSNMPSDSKKREQARKKEAQKKRTQKIPTVGSSKDTNDEPSTNGTTNGAITNGTKSVEMTEDGIID